ncbi:hypothetical protein HY065_03120 [Candidatus Berkelbacteria bacterium]|nr:hypothetical protein [Candidatus Berkelbacteria bacterium]
MNLLQEILDQLPQGFLEKQCIVTFGSSTTPNDSIIGQAATLTGQFISEYGYVNCNGGQGGTMSIVAQTVAPQTMVVGVKRHNKSKWNQIGYSVECNPKGQCFPYPFGMAVRKAVMICVGHGYVVFLDPNGGPGTGTELQTLIEMTMNLIKEQNPADRFYRPIAVICQCKNYQSASRKIAHYFGENDIASRESDLMGWLRSNGHNHWIQITTADYSDGTLNETAIRASFDFIRTFLHDNFIDRNLPVGIA